MLEVSTENTLHVVLFYHKLFVELHLDAIISCHSPLNDFTPRRSLQIESEFNVLHI